MPREPIELDKNQRAVLDEAIASRRFLAASRSKLDVPEIATWDADLIREFRLLTPIDLQALVVGPADSEPMVRLPLLLSEPGGVDLASSMPPLFDEGEPRPPGVHLHWAMPDALLRGTLEEKEDGTANRLSLPPLPDRWVVLRIVLPPGEAEAEVRGWVLEADRAVALPLDGWTEKSEGGQPAGVELDPDELTGTVGGSPTWSGIYDAVLNRFAFHDPLTDIDPKQVDGNAATYLVAGWWSDPANDPVDGARSSTSLDELLDVLRWRLEPEFGDSRYLQELNDAVDASRGPLGLGAASRFETDAGDRSFTPIGHNLTTPSIFQSQSAWAIDASEYFVAEPWHLRASLLHGAVYGVPVAPDAKVTRENRPEPGATRVALGEHDGDVLGALSTVPGTPASRRRDAERLLEAFTSQKINRLGDPDGLVEIETDEHAGGFASQPGGIAGTDRFEQRSVPGQAGGSRGIPGGLRDLVVPVDKLGSVLQGPPAGPGGAAQPATGAAAEAGVDVDVDVDARIEANAARSAAGNIDFASSKPELFEASDFAIYDYQWERIGITRPPTEPRVVERPAPRFTFPADPMVAVQGAGRSTRHANDGKASSDGKLTCRWPAQIITGDKGTGDGADLVPSLGNGSIPPEILSLAREVVVHDPYNLTWRARVAAATTGLDQAAIARRLVAEAGMRFGVDAVYDGSTQVFGSLDVDVPARRGAAGRAGLAQSDLAIANAERAQVADQLHTFSIRHGADPDPVGVTCWSQPWVPLWLEWEATVDPQERPSIDGWRLGSTDLDPTAEVPQGTTTNPRGRVILTTGAATTLQAAVDRWLEAEDARDATDPALSQADPKTERSLAALARAVVRTDIVTASLDGFGRHLLGFAEGENRRLVDESGNLAQPSPIEPPTLLASGRVRLKRARLVDAFGRTLEIPVDDVAVTVRDSVDDDPGAMAYPPRITRPARWRLRFVDAATPNGQIGTEARVDQIDPTLQVNPVAGFILPDHLDESLEMFDTDGSPLGELLTEPVGGGVTWEIAPGRLGPPSAGPGHGLQPAQHTLGLMAAGMIRADSDQREGGRATGESALAAFLRAVDTTLWTVDSHASMGGEHVAGLVGRPMAVVRAQIKLQLRPPDRVDLSDPKHAQWWAEAEDALAAVPFPVRIGELTRLDDGVLGFFVDDDYSRFRPVDRVVAELAADGGRNRGHLGLLGTSHGIPADQPIAHPYVTGPQGVAIGDSDTITVHLGQTVTLTLLMNPAGLVHVTSGILPRFSKALARDWVAPGLARIAPSLRTGPVLVDTDLAEQDRVRLPKVSVFGTDQDFWWRDTPGSWRTDALLAATQTALLPDTPAQFREGWIRVRPPAPDSAGPADTGGTP